LLYTYPEQGSHSLIEELQVQEKYKMNNKRFQYLRPKTSNRKRNRDMSYAPEKRTERQKRVVLSAASLYAEIMEIIIVMTALKCDFFIVCILNNVTMYVFLPKCYSFLVILYFISVTAIFQLFLVFCKSERNRNKTYC
jgi:hypothetical protein